MSEFKNYMVGDYRDDYTYAERVARNGLAKMSPVIITCAITGGIQGAEANPNLPETKEDQVQSVYDAYNAGASMVHIHARDTKNLGYNSNDYRDFLEVNARVREKCPDLIINNTCMGGRMINENNWAISPVTTASLDARPEVASFDITSTSTYVPVKARKAPLTGRDEDMLIKFNYLLTQNEAVQIINEMISREIKPEFEIFSVHDLKYLYTLIHMGLAKQPYWVQMLFGGNGTYPTPKTMIHATEHMPPEAIMSVIGIGPCQNAMLTLAMILGHHVRVGMEDNYIYGPGEPAKSNAQLVERIVRIAKELGRPIATPAQAREMMGLDVPRAYSL